MAELFHRFDACEAEAMKLVELGLPLPAYEQVTKASHSFNLLDARRAISVTERQRYILRVRAGAGGGEGLLRAAREIGVPRIEPPSPLGRGLGEGSANDSVHPRLVPSSALRAPSPEGRRKTQRLSA